MSDPDPADDEVATLYDGPVTGSGASTAESSDAEATRALHASSSATPNPNDALSFASTFLRAEVTRTRRFVPILLAMLAFAIVFLDVAGGNRTARLALFVGVIAAALAVAYLFTLTRRPQKFTEVRLSVVYGVCMLGVIAGAFYWGIFSPVAAIASLGIFFLGVSRSRRAALVLYLLCVVPQALLAAAIISGVLRDPGLVNAGHAGVAEQVAEQAMLQVVYLVTFLMARATRAQLDQAMLDHERATRAVAQREALLLEARQEFDRALQIGGPGRYTDQQIGSYRLGVMIGRGAMSDVYDAVHAETGAPAALKVLGVAAARMPDMLARFSREAQAAAKLESSHIVRLFEVSAADADVPHLAMERLRGQDLAHILRERRRLSLGEAVELAEQVADGLEVARAEGIVHRDVKPQNLFRETAGKRLTWKILDFGVSKLADHDGTLTRGHVVGTPMYMAPEQALGRAVDHRADVFALATVVYRALTGQPPYRARDMPSILFAVVHRMPQRPSRLVKVPDDVDRVLALGLAKRPSDRFSTAPEFARALASAASASLDRELRARADALVAALPWGSEAGAEVALAP